MKITMISNALEEVWEWKEKCYEESKDMTILDYLKRIHRNADTILVEMEMWKEKISAKEVGVP